MDNTVLVGLVGTGGVIVGAGVSTLGSYFAARLHSSAAAAQLAAEADEREKERREARLAAWRDRRLEAHEKFWTELGKVHTEVNVRGGDIRRAILEGQESPTYNNEPMVFRFWDLQKAQATLALVASEAAWEAADKAVRILNDRWTLYEDAYTSTDRIAHQEVPNSASLQDLRRKSAEARMAYLAAAKEDLGSRE